MMDEAQFDLNLQSWLCDYRRSFIGSAVPSQRNRFRLDSGKLAFLERYFSFGKYHGSSPSYGTRFLLNVTNNKAVRAYK